MSEPLREIVLPLREGLTLGRQGDLEIDDLKVSLIHARIVRESSDGPWLLEDNNSKNGIRSDGRKVKFLELTPGVIFYIGDQAFEVIELTEENKPVSVAEVEPPRKAKPHVRYWHEILFSFLESNQDAFRDRITSVMPMNPAIVLDFMRGIQVNSHWTIGYGPRRLGRSCIDLPIWEPHAPPVCFELLPSHDGVIFRTDHPEVVRLNDEAVDRRVLRAGDTIHIIETVIEVDFAR